VASLQWAKTQSGSLLSKGCQFLILKPYPIKAMAFVTNWDETQSPETRVVLSRKVGKGKPPDKFLCLTVESAMELAEAMVAGLGVLEP